MPSLAPSWTRCLHGRPGSSAPPAAAHTAGTATTCARSPPPAVEPSLDSIGAGYGIITPAGWEATDLLARTEGILLDPVYTSKAMAGLIDDVRHRRFTPDEPLVFVHTGGTPAVFAYRDE